MNFSSEIVRWYNINKRDLPWRNTQNPYFIWLSEIILQQTRVAQGMSYYIKFVSTFPTIQKLAKASEDEVLKLWQGLGYYSRARNLHFTAKEITQKYKGKFPQDFVEIKKLKGIGDYTAAAIASFAFDKPHAVVDGNVYRVLARVFDIKTAIDSSQGKKEFAALAEELLDKKKPALHNQAIMEFGAVQCVPQNPDCNSCCLNSICIAKQKKWVSELPVKEKKLLQRNRYFNYFIIHQNKNIFIHQRGAKDIWQGLFEFPLIETETDTSAKKLMLSDEWIFFFANEEITIQKVSDYHKHILSHQILNARFWEIDAGKSKLKNIKKKFQKIKHNQLNTFALPRLIDKVMNPKK